MTDEILLLSAVFILTTGGALFALVRQKRRREWAWHRLVDYAESRSDASRGLPRVDANDALVALFEAASRGDLDRLRDTRTLGVSVNARDGVGQTPLLVAAGDGCAISVSWLLREGASVNAADALGETALLKAARAGADDVVLLLLQSGASTECHHLEGWTPLIVAALHGHVEVVRALLSFGADRAPTVHDRTALALAQQKGHASIVALLESGGSSAHDPS